jgi:hypothetical protein
VATLTGGAGLSATERGGGVTFRGEELIGPWPIRWLGQKAPRGLLYLFLFFFFLFLISYLFHNLFKTDSNPFKPVLKAFKNSKNHFKTLRKHFS